MTGIYGLILVNCAYFILVSATFNKKLLHVRGLLMVSSYMFAGFGFIVGIGSIAGWNLVIGALNTGQFVGELRRQRRGVPVAALDPYRDLDVPGPTAEPHLVLTLALRR